MAFPDLQSPLGSAPDPEVRQISTVFAGAIRDTTCGIDSTSLTNSVEQSEENRGADPALADQIS